MNYNGSINSTDVDIDMEGASTNVTLLQELDETLKRTAVQRHQGDEDDLSLGKILEIAAGFNDPKAELEYLTQVCQQQEVKAIELNRTYIALRYDPSARKEVVEYAELMQKNAMLTSQALVDFKESANNRLKQFSRPVDLKLEKLPKRAELIDSTYKFFLALDKLRGFYENHRTPEDKLVIVARYYVDQVLGFPSFLGTSETELRHESTLRTVNDIISYFLQRFGGNAISCPVEEMIEILAAHSRGKYTSDKEGLLQRVCMLHSYIMNPAAPGANTISESCLKTVLVKVSGAEASLKEGWQQHNIIPEQMKWEDLRRICREKAAYNNTSKSQASYRRQGMKNNYDSHTAPQRRVTQHQTGAQGQDEEVMWPGRRTACSHCKKESYHRFHNPECIRLEGNSKALAAAQAFFAGRNQRKTIEKTEQL
jgi:hypothetical protein